MKDTQTEPTQQEIGARIEARVQALEQTYKTKQEHGENMGPVVVELLKALIEQDLRKYPGVNPALRQTYQEILTKYNGQGLL